MNFNQGIPGIPTLINSSAVLVTGNAASANALTVRQFGTGNVFVTSNSGGTVGLFVNAQSNVGIGTTNPGYILDMYGSGDQKQTGWASINATSMGGRPLNINYFGPGGGQHISAYALSGATTGGDSTVFYRYVGWIKGDTDSGNLGGFHMEGVIGGGLAETSYLTVDFTNRGITGGYKYSTLTGGTISSSMNVFMVSNTSVSPTTYDLYIKYGGSNYHGFNLDIKSFWNTFRFVNIEGTADPRTAPTSYATSWDILASANFVQKSATGNVGIGTVSPGAPLDVLGPSTLSVRFRGINDHQVQYYSGVSGSTFTGQDGGSSTYRYFQNDTQDKMRFYQGAGGAVVLQPTAGNVGIGTASPVCKLDVIGGPIKTYTSSDVARLIIGPAPSATNLDYSSLIESVSTIASNYASTLRFYTHGNAATGADPTLAMTINSSQQVGIGTASPGTTLDVRGSYQQIGGNMAVTYSQPSAASSIFLFNDSVNGCGIFLNGVSRSVDGGGGTGTLRNDYGDLRVQAAGGYNNALGITIKGTSGYVGIGSANPQKELDVFGNVRAYNMTQLTKGITAGGATALGNITFVASWDNTQGDGDKSVIIEVITTVCQGGGGYTTRVFHVQFYTYNDGVSNPQVVASTQIANSGALGATPAVTTGTGRTSATSVTVTTTPGFATTGTNRTYTIHARAICAPPGIGNLYFT